jgi:hypothetical protein
MRAEAKAIYEDGTTGDFFATGTGSNHRTALLDLSQYPTEEWRRVEENPSVFAVDVTVSEVIG